jgi:hypothetical protein
MNEQRNFETTDFVRGSCISFTPRFSEVGKVTVDEINRFNGFAEKPLKRLQENIAVISATSLKRGVNKKTPGTQHQRSTNH